MVLYMKSMGSMFEVRAIVLTVDEANTFCEDNEGTAVIDEDSSGLIYVANIKEEVK
jgi:hypothetical protein